MNLVTVVSPDFVDHAIELIRSFRRFYPQDRVIVCHFGGPVSISDVGDVYLVEVPMLCDHAHDPRFYFYKTYALQAAMEFDEPFIYLDSPARFLQRPVEIEMRLRSMDRFLVRYPPEDIFRTKVCTTRRCMRSMGCDADNYRESHYYWAAIQAYNPSPFNKQFVAEMVKWMMDPAVAGPSNYVTSPEPDNPDCLYHRNDQSCLALMIEKYGIHQPYDEDISLKYGDHTCIRSLLNREVDVSKLVISSRNPKPGHLQPTVSPVGMQNFGASSDASLLRLEEAARAFAHHDPALVEAILDSDAIQDSKDARIHRAAGNLLLRANLPNAARAKFLLASRLDPTDPDVQLDLGVAWMILGRAQEADTALFRALELAPLRGDAWKALGQLRLRAKDRESGIKAYLRASELLPNDAECLAILGTWYAREGQESKAISLLEKAHRIHPEDAEIQSELDKLHKRDLHPGPAVTAIVAVYKAGRFVRGCLDDLLAQTLWAEGRMEIVVVDTGSPDGESEVVREYQARHGSDRIRLVRTEDRRGLYAAWNLGAQAARGRFLTNANADDRHREDALERQCAELESHPEVDLVYADEFLTYQENATMSRHVRAGVIRRPEFSSGIMMQGCHMGPHPMWRRSVHDRIGWFDEAFKSAGDYDFWCRMALAGMSMRHIPEYLGLYLENPHGICNGDPGLGHRETAAIKDAYGTRFPRPPADCTDNYVVAVSDRARHVQVAILASQFRTNLAEALELLRDNTAFPHLLTAIDDSGSPQVGEILREARSKGILHRIVEAKAGTPLESLEPSIREFSPGAEGIVVPDSIEGFSRRGWLEALMEAPPSIRSVGVEPGRRIQDDPADVVNIGVVTYNRLDFTRRMFDALLPSLDHPHRITVVDNASTDGTREYLQEMKSAGRIHNLHLLPGNIGIAKASNIAWASEPEAGFYLKLDNDMVPLRRDWLSRMVRTARAVPGLGALGYSVEPKSYPSETIAGAVVRPKRDANIGGACFLVPRAVHEKLGWWCEDYGLYGEEDGDFALRIRLAGMFNAYMEDEDAFSHLPGGKAGAIDPRDLSAVDPDELRIHEDYRLWKDDLRRELQKQGGLLQRNVAAYQSGQRSLFVPRGRFQGLLGPDLQVFLRGEAWEFHPTSGTLTESHRRSAREFASSQSLSGAVAESAAPRPFLSVAGRASAPQPRVSIVVPVHGHLELTRQCVEALRSTTDPSMTEIVVVDDASPDDTAAWLRERDAAGILKTVLLPENKGFAGACNAGVAASSGSILVFLNNDTIPRPGWLGALLSPLSDPSIGLVGARLLYPEGDIQHAGIRLHPNGLPDHEFRHAAADDPRVLESRDRAFVTGACIALSRDLFTRVGGFDEGFRMYVEDLDLCLKVWNEGLRVRYAAECVVVHLEARTTPDLDRRTALVKVGMERLFSRWEGKWPAGLLRLPDWPANFRPRVDPDPAPSAPAAARAPVPLHWIAPALNFTGYARLNREALLALEAGGDVSASLDPSVNDPEFIKGLEARGSDAVAPWNAILGRKPLATGLCVVSDLPCNMRRLRDTRPGHERYAGLTMFETDRLPAGWRDDCLEMDEIWVPSTFNLRSFAESGVPERLLKRIPCGIDTDRFRPGAMPPLVVQGRRSFNFLSVFEWTMRKGWDVLLLAWARAFTVQDDVSLTLKSHLPGGASGIGRAIEEFYSSRGIDPRRIAPVVAIEGFLPESAMPGLYAAADAFALPTRGEGWGLPYLEAMACGVPVIATGWSAHTDFADASNSYLVDHALVPVAPEQTRMSEYYGADHLWAEPSVDHLVDLLRRCAKDPASVRERGRRARSDVQDAWSSRRTAEWIARETRGKASVSVPVSEAPFPVSHPRSAAHPPRIGFDGRTFSVPDSMARGIGHYSLHHLLAVLAERPGQDLTVLADDREPIPPDVRSRLEAAGARFAPWSARSGADFDLVHVADPMYVHPEFASPFQRMGGTRLSATFYDVTPLRMYAGAVSNWPGYLARLDALRDSGAHALCISEHTRRDLLEAIRLPVDRATTVMAGFNASFSGRRWSKEEGDELLRRLGIDKPFFLHVGAVDPHKNFETVLSACQAASAKRPCLLVVVGRLSNSLSAVRDQILQAGLRDVVFTDFLPREELELLYSRAVATLFLSRCEGFGFPVLEAMAQGCPVVCSDSTSIPEVAGNAALMHSPDDVQGVARSMMRLADSPDLRQEMSEKGRRRAAMFPWEAVARRTWEAWDALLSRPAPTAEPVAAAARVQWVSPIWDPSGYADESRAFVRHLASTDLGAGVLAWGRHSEAFRQAATPEDRRLFDGLMGREMEPNRPVVLDIPAHALGRVPGAGHHVGRTTFETDALPPDWVARCNSMDEIWVPCAFNRGTFAKAGVAKPILVVPEGVDVGKYRPGLDPLPLPGPSRRTTFLAVFEWTRRKGPDLLLRAWAEAFGPDDDVRLALRTYPPNEIEGDPSAWVEAKIEEELARHGRSRADCAPVAVIARQVPDSDMPRLYAAADVFVAPSRGEGWGRPHMEAMSCGVPSVATRWSGNLEFQDDNNSWLIDVPRLEEIDAREEFPFYQGQKWASPSAEHLREILRRAADHPEERRAKGDRARRDMVEKWDWRKIAPLAETRLREILAGVPAERSALAGGSVDADAAAGRSPTAPSGGRGPVRWCGQMFNYSGYARLAREAVAGLMDRGVAVTADPLLNDRDWFPGIPAAGRSRWTDLLSRTPEPGVLVCCDVPRDAKGNELFDQMDAANPGCAKRVGWTMFETDRLPAGWADSLNRLDEVWVPSEFNRRTFAEAGVRPEKLQVIPGSVDPAPYVSASPMALPGPSRGTTFLSVFQWTRRKGWDVLLRAWAKAFDPKADVRLVLRCHPFDAPTSRMRDIFRRSLESLGLRESDLAPVLLLDDFVPESEMPSLYAAADVFVLPSRGEGWGLPYLEAMAAGKPCIATAWGASLAFLHDGNAWLAAPRQLVAVGDAACRENLYLSPDHRWADPDPAEVSELLRRAASNVVERLNKGRQARQDAVSLWTPRRTADAIARRIDELGPDKRRAVPPTLGAVSGGRLSSSLEKVAAGLRITSAASRASKAASASAGRTPPENPTDSVLSVRWEGSQFVHHSLAHVNRALCLRLAKLGHDLSIVPFEPDQFGADGDPDLSILAKLRDAPLEAPCQVHVRQTWPPVLDAPAQGRWVVVQPWEFGSPPVDWIAPFRDQVDEIWAYTEYVKRIYVEAGIPEDQVRVVPLGVDTDLFRPGLQPLPGLERDDRLAFLYVGGTIARKGFDVLLNAWRQAFGPSDDVRLVVKAMGGDTFYKGQTGEAMVRELNASGACAPVLYFDQDLSPADLPRIYASGDVLVHPYRGEGFGLPIAEAMASGLPVVVTRGGAADDFCGDAESWGIPAQRVPVPGGKVGPFETVAPPWWLEPSVDALARTLREVAKDESGRRAKGEAARRRIVSGWTWDHAARAAETALREIAARPVSRRDGRPKDAAAALDPASEATLADLNRILFRAEAAAARGEMTEAETATREAVEAHPDQPLAWLARSMILRGLKKYPAASEAVQKSISLKESPEALLESVLIHRLSGRNARAKAVEKTLKGDHAPWLSAMRALYKSKGQAWPLDPPAKSARKSAAPPLKGRR